MGDKVYATSSYKLPLLRKRYNRRKKIKYSGTINFCRVCGKPRLDNEVWLYYCSKSCYRKWYNAKRVRERKADKPLKVEHNRYCLKCGKPNQKNWFCIRCFRLNQEIQEIYTPGALGIEFYELDVDMDLIKQIDMYKFLHTLNRRSFVYGWDFITNLKDGI